MQRRFALALGITAVVVALAVVVRHWSEPEVAPAPPEPAKPTLVEQRVVTENGVELVSATGPCGGKGAVVLLLGVGMEHDPPERSGMTFVLGELLAGPASKGGPVLDVDVGAETLRLSAAANSGELTTVLDALARRLEKLDATEADFDATRKRVLAERGRRNGGDPAATAMAYATESAHSSRARGYLGGIAEDIEAMTPDEATAFWRERATVRGATLAVVGEYEARAVTDAVVAAFGKLPNHELPAAEPAELGTVSGTLVMGDAPRALALAVAPPLPGEPAYPGFLVLATRLLAEPSPWQAHFDALERPETLLLTRALGPNETPDAAADALRAEVARRLTPPLAPTDVENALERFARLTGASRLDPDRCQSDPVAVAMGFAHRARLNVEPKSLVEGVRAVTEADLDDARAPFAPKKTAVVAAGGEIR